MLQHVPLFIGLRYIRAKRRNQFISFVSGFSLFGMMLGVSALVVVLSVMNGLDRDIKESILRAVPHGLISQEGGLADWQSVAKTVEENPQIVATAPYLEDFGLLFNDAGEMAPVQVQGILPQREIKNSEIEQHMRRGSLADLQPGEYGIVIGSFIAQSLGLAVGDKIMLTTSEQNISLVSVNPRFRRFTIVGHYYLNAGQLDTQLAFIHIADAQRLLRAGDKVHGLRVRTADMYRAPSILQTVKQSLPPDIQVSDWTQTQSNLFQAVKMEKIVIFIMLTIIVAIAAFNIISSLVLMVADKRADIAVLRTLGMTGRQIMAVFMIQGSSVGLIGIVFGLVLGGLGAAYLDDAVRWLEQLSGSRVLDPTIYIITVRSEWQFYDSLAITTVAALLSVLASAYPAFRASKVEPVEALRYE